jgi:hypothetical protein
MKLVGKWSLVNGRMKADTTADRINWLVEHYMVHVASDATGWVDL